MKKVISVILALCMIFSFTACRPAGGGDTGDDETANTVSTDIETEETADDTRLHSEELLTILENAVETTQPGTAGTSLKAVYAARDIISWLKENKPDVDTIKETVKYYFENCEYTDEAKAAFRSIKSVFETILESDAAQQLLDAVQIKLEELELSDEVIGYTQQLFDEIEKNTEQTE